MNREALKAAFAPIAAARKPEPVIPDGWTDTGRTKGNRPIYRVYATFEKKESAVRKILRQHWERMDLDTLALTPGATCPACLGSGMRIWGVCYWCNVPSTKGPGKGVLDARDIAYIEARRKGAGPICDVIAA